MCILNYFSAINPFFQADFMIKMREFRKLAFFSEKHSDRRRGLKKPRIFFTILAKPVRNSKFGGRGAFLFTLIHIILNFYEKIRT